MYNRVLHPIHLDHHHSSLSGILESVATPFLFRRTTWGKGTWCSTPVAVRCDRYIRTLFVSATLSLVSVLGFVIHDPYNLRFVLFFPVVFCLAITYVARDCKLTRFVTYSCLAIQFIATFLPSELPATRVRQLLRQHWTERSTGEEYSRYIADRAIGCLTGNPGNPYLLYRPDFSRRVVYLRATSAKQLIEDIDRQGLQVIYAFPDRPVTRILSEVLLQRELRHLWGHLYIRTAH